MPPVTEPTTATFYGFTTFPAELADLKQKFSALAKNADDSDLSNEAVERCDSILANLLPDCNWHGKFTMTMQSIDLLGNVRPYDCDALREHLLGEFTIR